MKFIEDLANNDFMLTIEEVGLGVPLTSDILAEPGASSVLFRSSCPYGKMANNLGAVKSVSRDAAIIMAERQEKDSLYITRMGKKHIQVAITGAHKGPDEIGQSHGWMCIIENEERHVIHFHFGNYVSRLTAFQLTSQLARMAIQKLVIERDFVSAALCFNQTGMSIDVIDSPLFELEDALRLVKGDNPLFVKNGKLHRAEDIIRSNPVWFRGSFNPPTLRHQEIFRQERTVCELTLTNAEKGVISYEDATHRIRMLNQLDMPVLVTAYNSMFVDFYHLINRKNSPTFALGTDVFNAVFSEKWCKEYSNWYPLVNTQFQVYLRPSDELLLNYRTEKMKVDVREIVEHQELSSTNARSSGVGLDDLTIQYIQDNGLYT